MGEGSIDDALVDHYIAPAQSFTITFNSIFALPLVSYMDLLAKLGFSSYFALLWSLVGKGPSNSCTFHYYYILLYFAFNNNFTRKDCPKLVNCFVNIAIMEVSSFYRFNFNSMKDHLLLGNSNH